MRKAFLAVLVISGMMNCKNPKTDLSGGEKISASDFIKVFPELDLPISVTDTALKNFGDTATINKAVFMQFVPDSALQNFSGANLVIHPAGLIHKEERDFLLATFSSAKQVKLGVFVLNDKHTFRNSFLLLNNNTNDKYNHSVSITEEPAFIIKQEKLTADNKSLYSRNGFAYNETSNSFEEVLHDSNEDTVRNNEILNPIDTLPSTNKFSGDYAADKKNFISVRDGKNALSYSFFTHFEKNKDCTGELKGTMTLTTEKTAVYNESGDPCVINFKFTTSAITIKEEGNCGNHRGINCLFDFTFKKKKPSAKASKQ